MRLKIDGTDIEAEPSMSVKDAARQAGIMIPGLCDYPGLKPHGGCRLCLVEIEGVRGFPSSCTMPIFEGMVVRTSTPALLDLRKSILEMLLSEHPSACLTCERAGRCDEAREPMRKVPQTMGCRYCPKDLRCALQETVKSVGLDWVELPHIGTSKEPVRGPFFDRDPNLCILCGRCVRACEAKDASAISFVFRGSDTSIGTAFDKPLEDVGCRFCGACVDVCPTGALSERAGRWAGPAENVILTTCPYCGANCQIGLEVAGGKLLRVANVGSNLCVRGRFGTGFVQDSSRLKRPLVRKNGKLVESSWEEALAVAANGLAKYSGEQFAAITSGICTNEALYMIKKFAREVMKSDAVASDPFASGIAQQDLTSLSSNQTSSSISILVIGDIAQTNPAIEQALKSAKNLVVISAFKTSLAKAASIWLRPDPGFEQLLLASMVRVALGDDPKFDAFGVSANDVRKAAAALAGAIVIVGPDCSNEVVKSASDLAKAVRGRLAVLGLNCNSQGACGLGLGCRYQETVQALSQISQSRIKAAYIVGSNPARAMPELLKPLSILEFLVVQDLFLTETGMLANVVLPAASFAEVDGTITGPAGELLRVKKAIDPLGSSKPDWLITALLAHKMGAAGFEFDGPESIPKEMQPCLEKMHEYEESLSGKTPETALEDYPLILVAGPSLYSFGSSTRTSRIPDLRYLTTDRYVEIHHADAQHARISPGDRIILEARKGRVKAVAKISRRVAEGVLRIDLQPDLRNIMDGRICAVRVRPDV